MSGIFIYYWSKLFFILYYIGKIVCCIRKLRKGGLSVIYIRIFVEFWLLKYLIM